MLQLQKITKINLFDYIYLKMYKDTNAYPWRHIYIATKLVTESSDVELSHTQRT